MNGMNFVGLSSGSRAPLAQLPIDFPQSRTLPTQAMACAAGATNIDV